MLIPAGKRPERLDQLLRGPVESVDGKLRRAVVRIQDWPGPSPGGLPHKLGLGRRQDTMNHKLLGMKSESGTMCKAPV